MTTATNTKNPIRTLAVLSTAGLLLLSLLCSLSLQAGQADTPIADSADGVEPLAAGDRAPRFSVRSVTGERYDFNPNELERPTILVTFRGGWCPYCNMHLSELRHVMPEINDMGVEILFLSGDRPDQLYSSLSDDTRDDIQDLDYTILSDADATAAIALGIAFRTPEDLPQRFADRGRDIAGSSIMNHGVLPVPAVFAVDQAGTITFAYVIPDYKVRLPADELLTVARELAADAP